MDSEVPKVSIVASLMGVPMVRILTNFRLVTVLITVNSARDV